MVDREGLQALIEADLNAWPRDGRSIDVLSAAVHYAQAYTDIPCDEIVEMVTREARSRAIQIEPDPNV
jgi:hypothetical protein